MFPELVLGCTDAYARLKFHSRFAELPSHYQSDRNARTLNKNARALVSVGTAAAYLAGYI